MTSPPQLPPPDQAIHFIRHDAFYVAAHAVADLNLFTKTDATFTIGPDTPYETKLTKLQGGILRLDTDHPYSRLRTYNPRTSNIFSKVWHVIRDIAETAITESGIDTFGPAYMDLSVANREVRTAQKKTAVAARSTLGYGYMPNPAGTGYRALYDFLGRCTVVNTLHIAGPRATLDDLTIINNDPTTFSTARAAAPVATALWFASRHHGSYDQASPPTGHQSLIEQAKARFLDLAAEPDPQAPTPRPDPEDLWMTAQGLNPPAISRSLHIPASLVTIARLVHSAGVQPSYTALTTLAKTAYHLGHVTFHPAITRAFIRESHLLTNKGKKHRVTQRDLADQFTHLSILRPSHLRPEVREEIRNITASISPQENITWQELLTHFPKHLLIPHSTPRAKKAKHPPTPRRFRPLTRAALDLVLKTSAKEAFNAALNENPVVTLQRGRTISLHAPRDPNPILTVTKHTDGTISTISTDYFVPGGLPNPHTPEETHPQWTTRGLKTSAAGKRLHSYLQANWESLTPDPTLQPPSHDRLALILNRRINTAQAGTPIHSDKHVSHRLSKAVASLVDPDIYEMVESVTGEVDIATYNLFAKAPHIFRHLLQTNPGALTWVINQAMITQPPDHPGQIITQAKASLFNKGLDPRHWRFAATLPAPVMRHLATHTDADQHQTEQMLTLHAMADSGTIPEPNRIQAAMSHARRLTGSANPTHMANAKTFITLYLKTTTRPPHHEAGDTSDYVDHLSRQDLPLKSTTWKGLVKASHKWHRQARIEHIRRQWHQILRDQHGCYNAWHSAIDTHQDGPHLIVPLTNEHHLFLESLRMLHCVVLYGPDCARGASRVFSILQDDDHIATIELVKTPKGWTASQARGRWNTQTAPDIHHLAHRLADRYTTAHRPEEEPPAWRLDHLTQTPPPNTQTNTA